MCDLSNRVWDNWSVDLYYFERARKITGHKSSKTTAIYTHVRNTDMGKIKSPLDNLQMKGGEED